MAQPARPPTGYPSQNGAGQQPYSNGECGTGAASLAVEGRRAGAWWWWGRFPLRGAYPPPPAPPLLGRLVVVLPGGSGGRVLVPAGRRRPG